MASNISAENALSSYALFNATDIKSFIINQLSQSDNPVFSGCSYLGSNMNALIDVLAVMSQQILFHFSVNTAESSFATANLFESMNKLVNILNYKIIGKQTSMLPVRFSINVTDFLADNEGASQITLPRFTKLLYNSSYYLKNELIIPIDSNNLQSEITIDSVLFEGELKESTQFIANGDEFETFVLKDDYIKSGEKFISDNFFIVYIDEKDTGEWVEYKETTSLFLHDSNSEVYERRFNEDMNYEFKFGNGVNGKKLNKNSKILIYYLVSSGESGILGEDIIQKANPSKYSSNIWEKIQKNNKDIDVSSYGLSYTTVMNTGNGTNISYPESVDSIRANAPRIFASQNRLFSLADYKTFINKNFSSYIKDLYLCNNDEFTRDYLKYYYDIGLDSPQEDSRLNIAQVEFMNSTNFNNVYCFVVPKVNTIISGKVPNYLNNTLKQEIVNSTTEYKGATHNLVIIDPIYKAITFGSYMDDTDFNVNQLENKLVLVRNRLTKYSYSYIKNFAIEVIKKYFNSLTIGSEVNVAQLTKDLNAVPGVKRFFIRDNSGNEEKKMTLFTWNPLYSNEDNTITQQNILNEPFVYPYFYDLDNIANLILIEDE